MSEKRVSCINLIKKIADHSRLWIKNGLIVDPIDNENIKPHYADTHFAVAYLLYNEENLAEEIMSSYLSDWNNRYELPEYHADFNNFAMCIFSEELKRRKTRIKLQEKINEKIIQAKDSHNFTINWLPMRIYTNYYRFLLTGDQRYMDICRSLEEKVLSAINSDWTIEDRLPKGISYNIQYNISTVAELLFLHNRGYIFKYINCLDYCINRLVTLLAPDGDINYMGRGCNQIFAWGPWVYLVNSINANHQLDITLEYLEKNDAFIQNNNILLNSFAGENKHFWYDYHYCSVYHGHLLMWLLLAETEKKYSLYENCHPSICEDFSVYSTERFQCRVFNGRKEYLSEWGPEINYIWSSKVGMIFKGGLGPWRGHFGNKYVLPAYTLRNKVGLIEYKYGGSAIHNRILDRLGIVLNKSPYEKFIQLETTPVFKEDDDCLVIYYRLSKKKNAFVNVPILDSVNKELIKIEVIADNQQLNIHCVGTTLNQYGYSYIYESASAYAATWEVRISLA